MLALGANLFASRNLCLSEPSVPSSSELIPHSELDDPESSVREPISESVVLALLPPLDVVHIGTDEADADSWVLERRLARA
jgi:hypothetical protein